MKETWNLREAVMKALLTAEDECLLSHYGDLPDKCAEMITDRLCAEIEANQAILGNELFKAKEEIAKLKDQDKEFHNLIANLHRDHLYSIEELEKKLEAADRLCAAAFCYLGSHDSGPDHIRELFNSIYNYDPTTQMTTPSIWMEDKVKIKNDSLGEED